MAAQGQAEQSSREGDRKLLRSLVKQIHPDLFPSNPYERQVNSDSLKALNVYVDELSKSKSPRPARLEFFVKDGVKLRKVEAQLTTTGNLSPLFFAFGLITAEELKARTSGTFDTSVDTDFLAWLSEQVQDALRTAEQHEQLKWLIRKFRGGLEEKYGLASVQVGAEYAVSLTEQERQLEALKVLESSLQTLSEDEGADFEGVAVQLYHPQSCPVESFSYMDELGNYNMKTSFMNAYVADDGTVHVVSDRSSMTAQLRSLDLERARTLTRVAMFWLRRVRELTPVVNELLGVRSVWCDTKTEQSAQKFVIWAGYLLEQREAISAVMKPGRKFNFSVIVHSDPQGPLISFHQSSPILNVRSDCPPNALLEYLASEMGIAASEAASEVHSSRAKEEALLERVRQVFEAKCVIKICMNDKVVEGAQRLLENAELIKSTVNLRGACIALDDVYEVWDSGFISIPYNFKIQELTSMVKQLKLLKGVDLTTEGAAAAHAAAASSSGNGAGPGERSGAGVGSSNGAASSSNGAGAAPGGRRTAVASAHRQSAGGVGAATSVLGLCAGSKASGANLQLRRAGPAPCAARSSPLARASLALAPPVRAPRGSGAAAARASLCRF